MADVLAMIQIHETGNGTIEHIYTSVPTNNISELPFATDVINWVNRLNANNKHFQGANSNVLKDYTIGSNTKGFLAVKNVNNEVVDTYRGLMFGSTSSSGMFNLDLTFTGSDIGNLKIVFDKQINNYPTSYIVEETVAGTTTTNTYSNSNVELQLEGLDGRATQIKIKFSTWSLSNANVGITYIENQVITEPFAKNKIDSFTTQSQLTSSPQNADFGVLANTGNIRLLDKDNKLYNDSEKGYLQMNTFGVELYVNNRLLQKHIVNDNPYYSKDKTMDISLTDKLSKLDTQINEHTFTGNYIYLYDILKYIMNMAGYSNEEVDEMFVDENGNDINAVLGNPNLNNIFEVTTLENLFKRYLVVLNSVVLKSGTLLEQLNKICQCANVYLTTDRNGKFKFSSARTTLDVILGNIIEIPYKKQASAFSFDILTNNRYNYVEMGSGEESNDKNVLHYGSNEILESLNLFTDEEQAGASEVLSSDIIFDYRNGVKTGTIDIFPSDYDNYHGDQIINWANGEMINIGDIVYVRGKTYEDSIFQPNGEFVFWRVVDRVVKYEGQIIVTLTLKQIERFEDLY